MVPNPYAKYKQMQVESTADPVRLIVLLYDGAIKALRVSKEHIKNGNFEGKAKELMRAHDIIFELLSSLDHERGGEIAKNLAALYTYLLKRIMEVNVSLDFAVIDEVIAHMDNLNSSWRELAKQRGAGAPTAYNPSDHAASQGVAAGGGRVR